MASYTVPINGPNGPGFITVNASSPSAAIENASQGGDHATGEPILGGHQATTGPGGTAVALGGLQPTGSNALQTAASAAGMSGGSAQVAAAIDKMLQAIADGNTKAFEETVREWNLQFGFDQTKFQDDVRRFNENLALAQAGLTGTYQGAETMQHQQQMFAQALATRQQGMAEQQQGYQQAFNVAQLASQLQANPFRQQQVLGQAGRLLSGQGVAGFSAPNVVPGVGTAGGNTQGGLGYLSQIIEDIKNPAANQTTADQFIANTPTPNKLDSTSFLRAAPSTQNIVLQAMQEKYGIDPNDALNQIKATLPQFTAPTTVGVIRR